ncbi:hypothetical protein AAFF_G00126690 [Aldrovandia affinis]|uniref:Anti-proliferative protein domain-containing protein n=1 Tax=Aldrovandia affinis TaxID=143900 RepID=A0AAD7RR64_9TELE|nr:hypothetical protein AAFF_G00126690 [Aldrovandia affinis]
MKMIIITERHLLVSAMKREVNAGAEFLRRLAQERGGVDEARATRFAEKLKLLLSERYTRHWYPDNPSKGQAFRCIRINGGAPCDESVCARSGESCRYFTVARFKELGNEEEPKGGSASADAVGNPDTSDYHSASSSECGSAVSSDTEEEGKEGESEGGMKKEEKKGVEKEGAKPFVITMKPRLREPKDSCKAKKSQAASLQYFYHPAPMWPQYKKKGPVFLTAVCPPPPAPFLGYYLLPKQPPQFIMPQATLQPWGAVKG